MLAALKDLKKPNDVGMLDLLQQIDLLEHLPLREVILHVGLLDCLDGHILASELVHAKCHLTECTLPNQLYELIVLKRRGWQLIVLFDVGLYELDQFISLLENSLIYLSGTINVSCALSAT